MRLLTSFDHYDTPLGSDGTPYAYREALRDEAVASGRSLHRSEAQGGFRVVARWEQRRQIHRNTAPPGTDPFALAGDSP